MGIRLLEPPAQTPALKMHQGRVNGATDIHFKLLDGLHGLLRDEANVGVLGQTDPVA